MTDRKDIQRDDWTIDEHSGRLQRDKNDACCPFAGNGPYANSYCGQHCALFERTHYKDQSAVTLHCGNAHAGYVLSENFK